MSTGSLDVSSLILDNTIENVEFITAKPLLSRLDVLPFVALYALSIGAYLNTVEEWQAIFAMIGILVVFVLHLVVLLLGYWHVDIRVKIAYNVHPASEVLKSFQSYNATRFTEGIRYAQECYESELARYKMWHTVWSKQVDAQYLVWKKQKEAYERNPTNAIPPGPFVGADAPKAPELGSPVALYNGDLLQVLVRPHKHSGNPTICTCVFDSSDESRIQYSISGLLTPQEVVSGAATVYNTTSKITLYGPKYCPPLKFSHHHMQYTIDPNAPLSPVKQGIHEVMTNTMSNATMFIPRPYPDANPLSDYLTHDLTPTTTFLVDSTRADESSDDEDDNGKPPVHTPLHQSHATFKLLQYGMNSLSVPIPSFITIFIENAMSPFFVFQVVCILLWMLDEYWYYSLFTLFMIVALECTVVWKRRSHLVQMLGEKPALPHVYVYRRYESTTTTTPQITLKMKKAKKSKQPVDTTGEWVFTPAKCLVPGDIVALPIYNDREQIVSVFGAKDDEEQQQSPLRTHRDYRTHKTGRPALYSTEIPCDLLLLSGSCVADESMLTGESVPQIKEDLISLNTYSDNSDENDTSSELSQNLDNQGHKRHILYSGTKLIGIQRSYDYPALSTHVPTQNDDENIDDVQNFDLLASVPPLPSSMDVVVTRVLRTGFSTTQGSLVRTILTASDNVLLDKEALYFILGLLCCAIISAYHVLMQGLADPTRSRYKLMLNVITILTSVVPPELPMQLSMAVNNALALLAKTGVFCTEPNRIPAAGQVNVCCFDKTGTLTSDEFLLTCAVTHESSKTAKSGQDNFIVMRSDLATIELADQSDTEEDNSIDEVKSLKANTLPVDMRLVMGCANELTMLQLPGKKTPTNDKPPPTQRIIGDPMEAVAFSRAGFQFFPQKQLKDGESGANKDNTNNKMYCDASPVVFDQKLQTYHTPKSIQLPAALQGVTNLGVKTRIESQVIHRFTFQSQLQRMSSIILINLPQYAKASQIPTSFSAESAPAEWLNSSLPTPALQEAAASTMLRSVVKGSPECIYNLLDPRFRPSFESYTEQHKSLARQGLRVLALAWKPLFIDTSNNTNVLCDFDIENTNPGIKGSIEYHAKLSGKAHENWTHHLKVPSRDYSEHNLFFAGIIGFNSPLKTQSLEVITHLQDSAHKTICVTGDHLLTAIAVAKQLNIAKKDCLLLTLKDPQDDSLVPEFQWVNEREEFAKPFLPQDAMFEEIYAQQKAVERGTPASSLPTTYRSTSLCINGDIFKQLVQHHSECLPLLCSITSVFARTLPYQKELILKNIKEHDNQNVSFVGDGTNDIGALSHAHIGIALLSIDTDSKDQLSAAEEKLKEMNKNPAVKRLLESAQKLREKGFTAKAEEIEQTAHDIHKRIKQSQLGSLMDGMEEDDGDGAVKLGDASLAAAFSAKHGSIRCLLDVIRQGRCALATTGQMYQILALQCLIAAYSLSALYFQGVRQSESQMTVGGMLNAAMSMLLSYAQPLEKVSPRRPNSKIFSLYNITSIALQFAIHLSILMFMVSEAMTYTSTDSLKQGQDETVVGYIPSVLNTVVFVLSTAMGATTILSNYVGYPFMTPLTWTPLFKVILGTLLFCVMLALESMPDINEMLEMTPMPTAEFGFNLATCIIVDCVGCVIVGLATKLIFGIVTWDDLTKPIPKDVISHSVQNKPASPATAAAKPTIVDKTKSKKKQKTE